MNKKINFIFKKKKIYKFFLYLLVFFIVIFSTYFLIPKFFNYTPYLIQQSLKKNSNIKIKNISNIDYKFFPSPRLRLSRINLEFKDNIMEVKDAEMDIILNPLSIINYNILDYDKFLIKEGSTNIQINKINQLYNYIKENQKKINFKNNNIILLVKNKKLIEINNSLVKINTKNSIQKVNINGNFFNHKISFIFEDRPNSKTKLILKIPDLDISTNILLENKNNFKKYNGQVDIEVLNNFFQFNIIKKENIKINKGFVRSSLINSLFVGNLSLKPYFSFNLDFELSTLNIEKLILLLQQRYFLEESSETEILKKIDGSLNFKNTYEGNIIFKNKEILFKNFKVGKNLPIFFKAKISEFGRNGKVQFSLATNQNEKTNNKDIKILGYLRPSNLKVTFDKIKFGKEIFTEKKIKNYEEKFNKEVVNNLLSNIFNEKNLKFFFEAF